MGHSDQVWFGSICVCVVFGSIRFGLSLFGSSPIWVCIISFYLLYRCHFSYTNVDLVQFGSGSSPIRVWVGSFGTDQQVRVSLPCLVVMA